MQTEYHAAPKALRALYANQIVNLIKNLRPPGRFLKKVQGGEKGQWVQIDHETAVKRVRQALRDTKRAAQSASITSDSDSNVGVGVAVDVTAPPLQELLLGFSSPSLGTESSSLAGILQQVPPPPNVRIQFNQPILVVQIKILENFLVSHTLLHLFSFSVFLFCGWIRFFVIPA